MQDYRIFVSGTPGIVRGVFVATFLCWISTALVLVVAESSGVDLSATLAGYWAAAVFAAVAISCAVVKLRGAGRVFWIIFGAGLLFKFLGDANWAFVYMPGPPLPDPAKLSTHDFAYVASHLLFIVALLYLVAATARRFTLLAALDALFVTFSVGMLAWYFVLGPSAVVAGLDTPGEVLRSLRRPAFHACLLFLTLVVHSTARRPLFVNLLVLSFATFLFADALFLNVRASGVYEIGDWPEMVWALGIVLIGASALWALTPSAFDRVPSVRPWSVFSSWLGPLSPILHFCIVCVWSLYDPPLPRYVIVGAILLGVYLSVRISLVSHIHLRIAGDMKIAALTDERGRISTDLHDTLKQSVHSLPMMLDAFRAARRQGKEEAAEEILERAIEASREASYRISRPVYELRAGGESGMDPTLLIRQTMRDIDKSFAVKVYDEMEAPLGELDSEEITTAYRIVSEALWNAVKHSKARNIRVRTRRVGTVFIVEVRDDGRGFCARNPPSGLGLSLMRSRAEEADGELDLISSPGEGATVQLRFTIKRRRKR